MQDILKHLASGGKIINEKGDTLGKNPKSTFYEYKHNDHTQSLTSIDCIFEHLGVGVWKIVPKYSDGIYTAKCLKFDSEVTLIKQGNEWGETDIEGYSKSCIKDYTDVTYIGPLPSKEPTIANKIAAVPNDFVPDWSDEEQYKWNIRMNHKTQTYSKHVSVVGQLLGVTYFPTKEEAQRVIDEVLS